MTLPNSSSGQKPSTVGQPARKRKRVRRKDGISAPKLKSAGEESRPVLTLEKEKAAVKMFTMKLQALAPDSPPEAIPPLVNDLGFALTPYRANLVLCQLETRRRWQHALLLVRWMEGQLKHPPVKDTYAKLFAILAAAGEHEKVADCYRVLKRRSNLKPDHRNLLRIFGQGGCLQAARELLDDLRSRGIPLDVTAYNHAINAAAPGGACFEAEALLDELERDGLKPDGMTFGVMIEVMGRGGRREDAVGYFERYLGAGFEPTVATYKNLLQALVGGGQAELAEKHFREMRGRGLAPSAACYSAVACAHAVAGNWRKGVEVIESMPLNAAGRRPLVISLTGLIAALDRAGRLREGLEVFEYMKRDAGCVPNALTYAAVVSALARDGEIEKAEALIAEMRARGFPPSVPMWGALLCACASRGLHAKVRQLLLDMKRAGCDPEVGCFETLVQAYAADGRVREGLELLTGFGERGIPLRQSMYAALMGACKEAGDAGLARELWAHAIAHLPDPPTPRLCAAYMEALLSVGLPEEALSVFRSAPELGTEPDSHMYALAIDACSQTDSIPEGGIGLRREFGEGIEYWQLPERTDGSFDEFAFGDDPLGEELERGTNPGGRAFDGKAVAETGEGKSSEAEQGVEPERTAETEPESGAGTPGVSEGTHSIDAANRGTSDRIPAEASAAERRDSNGTTLAGAGKPELSSRVGVTTVGQQAVSSGVSETQTGFARARQLYHDVLARRLPLSRNVFLAVLRVCLKHGELREALEVPDQMAAAGVKADTRIYNHLLLVCSASGNWAAGVTVKQRMVSEGVKPDWYTFNVWIRFAGRCQKTDEAVAAFEEMGELGLERTVVTWNALIGALGAGKRWREALAAFRKLQGFNGGVNEAVKEEVRLGDSEGVRGGIKGEAREEVRLGEPREEVIVEAREGVSKGFSGEVGKGLGKGPREGNGELLGDVPRKEPRESVAEGFGDAYREGGSKGVRKGVRTGASDRVKPSVATYDIVIRLLARAGRVREGLEVLGEMRGAGFRPDARVYNTLGEALYVGKDWETFLRLVEAMRKQGLECNDALSGRVRIVKRRLAKQGRRERGVGEGVSAGGRDIDVSEGGEAGAGFSGGVSGEGREGVFEVDGSESGSSEGRGSTLDSAQDGNRTRLLGDLDAGEDDQGTAPPGTDTWQSLADEGDETDGGDEFDSRRVARRGVDWRRVTGVPYRAPREVVKRRRRRARVAGRKIKEWVHHTGRGTSQDLVKLLSGDLGNLDRVARERSESRYVDRFGSRAPDEEDRVEGD
ncbi:putative Pentatricopeptide repeat domain containing protein [Klebsormidium nitens]|uniref:Putative Pentatricopeptide repeat domain containing protein n=1 Tax=Klebsormidium nitens TaxID=105231 RepID=A0A0U9HIT2_KLENI|nr:putative Pentatricopeptide repeat domain containing protein [Klebsormidium nitens]|eukprot:GAQ80992.1 putative Pentatricopeptide repeat domain containing protein [Klebsormidium nitens]